MQFYTGRAVRIIGHHWHIGRHGRIAYIGTDSRAMVETSYGIEWCALDDLEPCEHVNDTECVPTVHERQYDSTRH